MKKKYGLNEWSELRGEIATVGITVDAAKEIGEIVFVELPRIGSHVVEGQEVVVLESTKAAVDIYSPLSGEVVAVNELLRSNVQHINSSPEQDGWLFQLKL
jgi:glycine cleavage system H protein